MERSAGSSYFKLRHSSRTTPRQTGVRMAVLMHFLARSHSAYRGKRSQSMGETMDLHTQR
jgi:hypothetical protein